MRLALLLAAALSGPALPALAQSPSPSPAPWTLGEEAIREIVGRVRAGRDLTPKQWPDGARVAVGLSFDFDNETIPLRDGNHSVSQMSQGEYGARAGLPRVLALLGAPPDPGVVLRARRQRAAARGRRQADRGRRPRGRAARLDPRAELAARRGHRA